jgi:hypothetical protein
LAASGRVVLQHQRKQLLHDHRRALHKTCSHSDGDVDLI